MPNENFKPEENSDLDKAIADSLAKGANDSERMKGLLKQAGLDNSRDEMAKVIDPQDVIADMQFEALERSMEPKNQPFIHPDLEAFKPKKG